MAKRSREDFEPSSPESETTGEPSATARSVIHPSTEQIPSSTSKFVHLGPESGEVPTTEMRCSLPPHRGTLTFASFEEYDVHYAKTHTNRCLECRKNFPTEHFLNLHIEENHDPMILPPWTLHAGVRNIILCGGRSHVNCPGSLSIARSP